MKLGLLGFGKMGQGIAVMAEQHGHEVGAIVASSHAQSNAKKIDSKLLTSCDVCIDYTHPSVVAQHIQELARLGKDMVVGTTGWEQDLPALRSVVEEAQVGLIYAPNFSIGVHLFHCLVKQAAHFFTSFSEYDASVQEVHHRYKTDSPSGTALLLARTLLDGLQDKTSICTEGNPRPDQLQVSSTRTGETPGTHTVFFDSLHDTITLTHTARSREGFIAGTLQAAEWIRGRKGVFTLDDMIDQV